MFLHKDKWVSNSLNCQPWNYWFNWTLIAEQLLCHSPIPTYTTMFTAQEYLPKVPQNQALKMYSWAPAKCEDTTSRQRTSSAPKQHLHPTMETHKATKYTSPFWAKNLLVQTLSPALFYIGRLLITWCWRCCSRCRNGGYSHCRGLCHGQIRSSFTIINNTRTSSTMDETPRIQYRLQPDHTCRIIGMEMHSQRRCQESRLVESEVREETNRGDRGEIFI